MQIQMKDSSQHNAKVSIVEELCKETEDKVYEEWKSTDPGKEPQVGEDNEDSCYLLFDIELFNRCVDLCNRFNAETGKDDNNLRESVSEEV